MLVSNVAVRRYRKRQWSVAQGALLALTADEIAQAVQPRLRKPSPQALERAQLKETRLEALAAKQAWRNRSPGEILTTALLDLRPSAAKRLPPLDKNRITLWAEAHAHNTARSIASDLASWTVWCRANQARTMPATLDTVLAYLNAMAGQGRATASLVRMLGSVQRAHLLFGVRSVIGEEAVKLTLKAIRKARRDTGVRSQRQALPLRLKGAVSDMVQDQAHGVSVEVLLKACGDDLQGDLDRALLLVAYTTGMRSAELMALQTCDFDVSEDKSAILKIRWSKTDQGGEGALAYVSQDATYALQTWLAKAAAHRSKAAERLYMQALEARWQAKADHNQGKLVQMYSEYLFRAVRHTIPRSLHAVSPRSYPAPGDTTPGDTTPCYEQSSPAIGLWTVDHRPLHTGALARMFRRLLRTAFAQGLLPAMTEDEILKWERGLSGHSTRVGITQDLFAAKMPMAAIMNAMRWKSEKQPQRYAENLAVGSNAVAQMIKQQSQRLLADDRSRGNIDE